MLGGSNQESTPRASNENGHNVREYIRKAREDEKRQKQRAEEAQARAKEERKKQRWEEPERKEKEQRDQEQREQERREQEKLAEEKDARLQIKWTELSQQFETQISSVWTKVHVLEGILEDLNNADEVDEPQRGICRYEGIFANGKAIQNCPGIVIEEEYSDRAIVRKAILKQREKYWTELEAVEKRRDTAWWAEIYTKAG
jgi:hypothetical protein